MICALISVRFSGVTALTVPCVPTGMKTGVWITPCLVLTSPLRAAHSEERQSRVYGVLCSMWFTQSFGCKYEG
ncbi:MAG: hypothetical protein ACD_75C02575G0001 [uncultured bacterium]|nr:MAG: hypothetical protein ACD_75C02575G0001 [uncultured bacterium]